MAGVSRCGAKGLRVGPFHNCGRIPVLNQVEFSHVDCCSFFFFFLILFFFLTKFFFLILSLVVLTAQLVGLAGFSACLGAAVFFC